MVKKVDARKREILKAIIHEHILTAEPVGSRTLAKIYKLGVSSATIRNEMSDLEELGYIEQPYTSAGRIPSDKAYRFYVDSLINENDENTVEDDLQIDIEKLLHDYEYQKNGIQNIMTHMARMLSQLTHYTSLVSEPLFTTARIKHVQLLPVSKSDILILIITDNGLVNNKLVKLKTDLTNQQIRYLNNFFVDKLNGGDLNSMNRFYLEELEKELINKINISHDIMEIFYNELLLLSRPDDFNIYLGGTSYILEQPEFNDLENLKRVLKLFDHEELLKELFIRMPDKEIEVRIGQENDIENMHKCSIVFATYSSGNNIGKIGVIGPTRMQYPRVMATVNIMSKVISKIISELSG